MSHISRSAPGLADYSLLVILAAMWGGSFTLIAVTVGDFPPAMMSMIRLFIGGVILMGVAAVLGERIDWTPRTLFMLAMIGLFGNALPFALIAWGQQVVDAGLASILMGVMPIATLVLAHYFTADEPLSKWKVIGVLVGLIGLVLLVGPAVLTRLGDDGIRQIAILGAAISYGINAIITKKMLNQPRRAAGAALLIAGAVMLVPAVLLFELNMPVTPHLDSVLAIIMLAIFPTALAALLMFIIIDRQGAGFFSQINLIVPLAGVFWAFVFLSEKLEPRALVALLTILSGVAIARIGTSKQQPTLRREPST